MPRSFFIYSFALLVWGGSVFGPRAFACSPVAKRTYYVVQPGDQLGKIVHFFGFRSLWEKTNPVLKAATASKLPNPDLIRPGQEIVLPFDCQEEAGRHYAVETSRGLELRPRRELSDAAISGPNGSRKISSEEPSPAEAPQAAIAQPEEPRNARDPSAYTELKLSGLYGFYRINSTGSSNGNRALILSDPSFGLKLGWEQIWSDRFVSGEEISYASIKMRRASAGSLEAATHTMGNIDLYLGYRLIPWLQLKAFSSYGKGLFARAVSPGTATLDSIYQSRVGVSLAPTLVERGNLSLGVELGGFRTLPASNGEYAINKSNGYLIASSVRQNLRSAILDLKIIYEKSKQPSNISNQENTKLATELGLAIELGK